MNNYIKSILAMALCSGLTTLTAQNEPEPPKPDAPKPEEAARPDAPRPEQHRPEQHRPEPKKELRTWLGVASSHIEPALRQHLDLNEGFGVQISHIQSDSPAAASGLKTGDILTMIDDQLLTTPEHLSILIRSKKKGDAVEVTYMRKGDTQKLSVTLGEHEMPVMEPRRGFMPMQDFSPEVLRRWHDGMLQQHQEFNRGGRMPEPPRFDNPRGPEDGRKDRARHESANRHSMSHSQSTTNISNDQGSVVMSQNDGKGQITITDKEGKEIYNGPFDVGRGIESLPENARDHLREMKVDQKMLSTPPMPHRNEPKPEDNKPAETPEPVEAPKPAEVL
jgi:serine protease Do